MKTRNPFILTIQIFIFIAFVASYFIGNDSSEQKVDRPLIFIPLFLMVSIIDEFLAKGKYKSKKAYIGYAISFLLSFAMFIYQIWRL